MTYLVRFRDYVSTEWRRRFGVDEISVRGVVDLSSIVDFVSTLLIDWISSHYPYAPSGAWMEEARRNVDKGIYGLARRYSSISLRGALEVSEKVYEKVREKLFKELEARGVVVITEYNSIETLFKSRKRWSILEALAGEGLSVGQIARRTGCREEVVRRFLSELKGLGLLKEGTTLSSRGRPVKTYRLRTPIVVVDMRLAHQH